MSDAQLTALLQKAARRLNRSLGLTGGDLIVVDASALLVNSDPNGNLHDLLLLQTECLISKRDFNEELNSGGAGLLVKDGEQTLDNRGSATARQSFFDSKNSPCDELKSALLEYKLNNVDGKLVW